MITIDLTKISKIFKRSNSNIITSTPNVTIKSDGSGTKKIYIKKGLLNNQNTCDIDDVTSTSAVYSSIKIVAETLSKLPINLYTFDEVKGKILDKNDYRYKLLHYSPNSYTTSSQFWESVETIRCLKGNSYVYLNKDINNQVLSMEIIDNGRIKGVKIVKDAKIEKNNGLYYILSTLNDKNEEVKTDIKSTDLLHFKGISNDGIFGINPIEAIRLNISMTQKGLKTLDNYYSNNANSSKFIQQKSDLIGANIDETRLIEMVEDFKNNIAGEENSGEIIVLPPSFEIKELQLNFADAIFIQTINWNTNQIAGIFGVPASLIGGVSTSTYSNFEQLLLQFRTSTMSSIVKHYEQELELKLLTYEERISGKEISFNIKDMMLTDTATRISYYKELSYLGYINGNFVCDAENLPRCEKGEVYRTQLNMNDVNNTNQDTSTKK